MWASGGIGKPRWERWRCWAAMSLKERNGRLAIDRRKCVDGV